MSKLQKPNIGIQPAEPAVSVFQRPKTLGWILAIVSFALYAGTIGHNFVLDDIAVIQENRFVHEGFGGIDDIFSSFYWEGYWDANAGLYRPLSLVMFAIEWAISPNNPQVHHFVNVMVYVFSIVLLFRLCRRLLKNMPPVVPFLVALSFALHPIHTEVVDNIKSRDELLCFLFFVLLFLQLSKEVITGKNITLAALFFFLSLLSKEAAILFLPVILLYFLLIRKFTLRQIVPVTFYLGIVAVLWFALHQYVIRTSPPPVQYTYHDNSLVSCGKSEQVATGIELLGKYAGKSIWPSRMTYDYSFNDIPCVSFASPVVWCILLLFGAVAMFCWKWRRKQPWLLFGFLFFTITILLITNMLFLIGATFGERLLYTPVLGIIILLVVGAYALTQRYTGQTLRNVLSAITVLLAIGATASVIKRNADWKSNETLFKSAAEIRSNSARVHANYGTILMQQAQQLSEGNEELYRHAIYELDKAVNIDSNDAAALINLGVSYYHTGNYRKSVEATLKANKLQPADTTLFFNLGDAYFALKSYNDAQKWYERGIRSDKTKLGDYERLGMIYFDAKNYPRAIDIFALGLKRFPDNESLLMNTASCYGAMNDFPKAAEMFYAVYQLNPSNRKALEMMRMSEARGGFKVAETLSE